MAVTDMAATWDVAATVITMAGVEVEAITAVGINR